VEGGTDNSLTKRSNARKALKVMALAGTEMPDGFFLRKRRRVKKASEKTIQDIFNVFVFARGTFRGKGERSNVSFWSGGELCKAGTGGNLGV